MPAQHCTPAGKRGEPPALPGQHFPEASEDGSSGRTWKLRTRKELEEDEEAEAQVNQNLIGSGFVNLFQEPTTVQNEFGEVLNEEDAEEDENIIHEFI